MDYLQAHENTVFFFAVVGTFSAVVLWETAFPRRQVTREAVARWGHNVVLSLINQVVVYWVSVVSAIAVAWWVTGQGLGLFTRFDIQFVTALILTTLTFELLTYVMHRLLHEVPWLWRIHRVHHSDTEVDFSTTYRSHPLEVLIVAAATIPVVALLGPPVAVLIIYQVMRVIVNIFAHGNVYLPEWVDRWLRYLIVTPDFHRCHHSSDQRFTNSNYGAFLPLFDYLFRSATHKPFNEQPDMRLGLEHFRRPRDSGIDRLLLMPFIRPGTNNLAVADRQSCAR